MSINGSSRLFSTMTKAIAAPINKANAHQRIDSDKESKNKIKPSIVNVNKMTPEKSIRFKLKFTSGAFGKIVIAIMNETRIIGMLMIKIDGQCHSAIKRPPIVGPKAADVDEKMETTARACACFDVISSRTILIPLGNNVELPIACNARQPSKNP